MDDYTRRVCLRAYLIWEREGRGMSAAVLELSSGLIVI